MFTDSTVHAKASFHPGAGRDPHALAEVWTPVRTNTPRDVPIGVGLKHNFLLLSAVLTCMVTAADAAAYDRMVTPPVPWSVTWTDAPGGSATFAGKDPHATAATYWAARSARSANGTCYSNTLEFKGTCISPPKFHSGSAAQYSCPATNTFRTWGTPTGPVCFEWNPRTIVTVVGGGVSKSCPVSAILDQATEECMCPPESVWVPEKKWCYPVVTVDYSRAPKSCQADPQVGNPIYPLTGAKRQAENFEFGIGWLAFKLTYNNEGSLPIAARAAPLDEEHRLPAFGMSWFSNMHRQLLLGPTTSGHNEHTDRWAVRALRPDGSFVNFVKVVPYSGYRLAGGGSQDSLIQTTGGFRYVDQAAGNLEIYDKLGRLVKLARQSGQEITFQYAPADGANDVAAAKYGLLSEVRDSFDRRLIFEYTSGGGRFSVSRIQHVIAGHASVLLTTAVLNGQLTAITRADGSTRRFLYANGTGDAQLSGVVDELGVQVATYTYDSSGRATSTERGGGVNRYTLTYLASPVRSVVDVFDPSYNVVRRSIVWIGASQVAVTGPVGAASSINGAELGGQPVATLVSQPAGAGCGPAVRSLEYNPDLTIARSSDFTGNHACFAYETTRRNERTRVEGLAAAATCSAVLADGAALPAGSRKISKLWHPDWNVLTGIAEPGRIVRYVFNGQPDPYQGGATAQCASQGLLPDGKPLVVKCAQYEVATTDAFGARGFLASAQPGAPLRTYRWTYNQFGQMLSERDPLGNLTTYTYYTSTNFTTSGTSAIGHTLGDLASVTLPLTSGGSKIYSRYDSYGNALEITDENGVATTFAYDSRRQRVAETTAGQTTTFDYWPTGLIKRRINPNGSALHFEYDAAQRLILTRDHLGNRIVYTLDNFGNRTNEAIYDATGTLRRVLSRSFDALGRVQQSTGID